MYDSDSKDVPVRFRARRYLSEKLTQKETVMDFGFTNDEARIVAAETWRDAALADGWTGEATYAPTEGMDRAALLHHSEGYQAQIVTRRTRPEDKPKKWKFEASIAVWGPDGLAVAPPNIYDMAAMRISVSTCLYCNVHPVKTVRVGFAGRACETCQPGEEKKLGRNYYD